MKLDRKCVSESLVDRVGHSLDQVFVGPGYRSRQNASDGQNGNLVMPVSVQPHPIQNASGRRYRQTDATILELRCYTAITGGELAAGLRGQNDPAGQAGIGNIRKPGSWLSPGSN